MQLKLLSEWVSEHKEDLPAEVLIALVHYGKLVDGLSGSKRKLTTVLSELRRALGITPSSERRKSGAPLVPLCVGSPENPENKRAWLEKQLERVEWLTQWHEELGKRHRRKMKDIEKKIRDMPVEAIELTAEEKAECAKKNRELMERMRVDTNEDGESEAAFESVSESLMAGAQLALKERAVFLKAPVDDSDETITVLDTVIETRERYDFSFSVTKVNVEVEKKVILDREGERRMVSASTAALGPSRYCVTWEFLAYMSILVVQYALPFNRLGKLLSTPEKKFTAGALGRLLHYVAVRFLPIYLELIDQLADADILMGDDTPTRVVEVNSYFEKPDNEKPPPWAKYRTREAAAANKIEEEEMDASLGAHLAAELGFEFPRKNGKGAKQSFNTTTVSGRRYSDDPRSLIVAYRSHLGGFGNLLAMLLEKRKASARELIIQSDLATVNVVSDEQVLERFDIRYVGCMSHARRPFALYEHEDPDMCAFILHLFKGLAIHEQGLNLVGRNRSNVLAVRGTDSRATWQELRELAELMTKKWSASTKLGAAARYLIRHYDKLTAYLDDPRLELTNNFSERMLRLEKLIESASLFRRTLEGRFALDIMRSVLQTAVAAGLSPDQYLLEVLRAEPEEVAQNPELFTPLAVAEFFDFQSLSDNEMAS